MDIARKIAIGIVMIIPAFVGAGALYDWSSGDWASVILWVGAMAVLYGSLISGKLSSSEDG